MERIYIFDTTLRDGEQSPGASMTIEQKQELALQLESLGVDVIEAGFPISSPQQYEGCRQIAMSLKSAVVAALARTLEKDIDAAAESIGAAQHPRIHTFISTSPIHMEHKLQKRPEEVIEMAAHAVRYARNRCAEVEFSPEDATRSDLDFMCRVLERVIDAGASIINIPDTVGYSTPIEISELITAIRNRVSNIDKATISIHCHDDLGLAVANTISALKAGARQAELTINGIGERAGNAALEELVMALNVRKDLFGLQSAIDTRQIYRTSRMLSTIIGFPIARNKAIVGENAFAHEAGIHQHGVLANRKTYEIMTPESVGRDASKIVLGRHSGLHGFRSRLDSLAIQLSEEQIQPIYTRFLEVADRKKEVYDEDIIAIVGDELAGRSALYHLEYFHIESASDQPPNATVRVRHADDRHEATQSGDGPIDAIFRAIEQATATTCRLEEYNVQALTSGKQAMGEVSVVLSVAGQRHVGHGSSTDIVEASAKAYLNAVGRARVAGERSARNG